MAKTGTWYKKLCDKQKKHIMKTKLGNEVGVMSFCSKAKPLTAHALNRKTIDDKPLAKGVTYPEDGRGTIVMKEGWRPRAFGSRKLGRQVSGSYLAK